MTKKKSRGRESEEREENHVLNCEEVPYGIFLVFRLFSPTRVVAKKKKIEIKSRTVKRNTKRY